jgi:hypothetical protein
VSRRRRTDVLLAIALAVWGYWLASGALGDYRGAGGRPFLQQREFAPAVLLACGRGYQNVDETMVEPVRAFLAQERPALDCAELPPSLPVRPLRAFQRVSRYLELAVAAVWKVSGVEWRAVDRLNAAAYGIDLALLFVLCRFVAGPALAVLAVVAWGLSPLHLTVLVDLRDYVKAPFILGAVALVAWMIRSSHPRRAWLAAAAALLAGIGAGFRTDLLLIVVPIAVAALLAGTTRLSAGVGAAMLCAGVFTAAALPILRGYKDGAVIPHVILLGLSSPFDARLGLETPPYRVAPVYHDWYAIVLMKAWIARRAGDAAGRSLTYATPAYDEASLEYLGVLARHLPADLLLRGLSAAARSVTVMFDAPYDAAPQWLQSAARRRAIAIRGGTGRLILPLLPCAFVAAAVMVMRLERRKAIAIAALALTFPAMSVLQFHERHVFYFEVLSLLACVCLLAALGAAVLHPRTVLANARRAGPALAVLAAAAVILAIAVLGARAVQRRQLTALFAAYEAMPRHPQTWTTALRGAGQVLAVPAQTSLPGAGSFTAIDFARERCGSALFRGTVRYRHVNAVDDFSFDVWINLLSSPRERLYFPAVSAEPLGTVFEGLELPAEAAGCIAAWSIGEPPAGQPLLIAHLPQDWRGLSLRQRRGDGGGGVRDGDRYIYLNRPDRAVSAALRTAAPGDQLETLGGTAPNTYLLRSGLAQAGDDQTFVLEGTARRGGFVVGLQTHDRWTETIVVSRDGPFLVLLRPAAAGEYRVVVADGGEGGEHAIALTRAGWLPRVP